MFTVSETCGFPSAAVLSTAARLLLPMISPVDVNMIIERELMKTESTSAITTGSTSVIPSSCPPNDTVSTVSADDVELSTVVKSVAGKDQQSVPVLGRDVDDGSVSENCNRRHSPTSPSDCGLKQLSSGSLCTDRQSDLGEEQSLHCKLHPTADKKKSNGADHALEHGGGPSVQFTAQQTSSSLPAVGYAELPFKSAAALSRLCKTRLSSDEINNNCRRGYVSSVHLKVGSNVVVARDAATRKSQRCNRGRRYHELMSRGVLHHHTARKRYESQTL